VGIKDIPFLGKERKQDIVLQEERAHNMLKIKAMYHEILCMPDKQFFILYFFKKLCIIFAAFFKKRQRTRG